MQNAAHRKLVFQFPSKLESDSFENELSPMVLAKEYGFERHKRVYVCSLALDSVKR